MRAMAIQSFGGPEKIELLELPDPPVGPDTVLVRTRTAGINPVDYKVRQGKLAGAFPCHFPLVLGWDVAGVVEAVGPAVTEFAEGDEVIGYVRRDDIQHGTYAELVPAPVRTLAHRPARASWAESGGLPLAGLTAYQLLLAVGATENDTVLVHAAAGGVGSMAVQIAQILGAQVIGTASETNHDALRDMDVEPVAYGGGLTDRVRDLAPDGIDAAVDLVGGDALSASADLVADRNRIASIIDAAGVHDLDGHYIFVRPNAHHLAQLADWVDTGRLSVTARTYPLDQAAEAHRELENGHVHGKLVLEV